MLIEGEVSLNQKTGGTSYFLIYRLVSLLLVIKCFRNKAKIIQHQGQVMAGISKTKFLNDRHDALSVGILSTTGNNDQGEKKPEDNKPTIVDCKLSVRQLIDMILIY